MVLPLKEWQEQRKLFDHARAQVKLNPISKWRMLFGSMNGLRSTPAAVQMAKLCGMAVGFPDTGILVMGHAGCPGAFCELKRKHKGWESCGWDCASDDQIKWRNWLKGEGYEVEVAHGADEAINFYTNYLEINE